MEELITVIVPIYNVENYLSDCIQSIIDQTYTNLEIILVDDGSMDNSLLICKRYEQMDSRVIVIHQKNLGLSGARNTGIKNAHGKLLLFVDSDDYIDKKMIESLYHSLKNSGADLAICNFNYVTQYKEITELYISPMKNELLDKNGIIDKLFQDKYWYYVVAWNKLYKKELWNSLTYPVGYIHEDEAVIHRIFDRCSKVVTITDSLYYYRQVPGSIMNSGKSEKKLDKYSAYADRIVFLQNDITNENMKKLIYSYWSTFLEDYFYYKQKNKNSIYLKRMKKSLRRVLPIFIKNRVFNYKEIIVMLIFLINPTIYEKLFYKKKEEN